MKVRRRKGFVLSMWTGLFPLNRRGCPVLFRSEETAQKALDRYPAWGHAAVSILPCEVVTGESANGLPDYHIGGST